LRKHGAFVDHLYNWRVYAIFAQTHLFIGENK